MPEPREEPAQEKNAQDEQAASPTPTGQPAEVSSKPEQTSDDTDAGWGERPSDAAHDQWLEEQRPPHWG